jgi:tRNA/tmRNA/rRNA uracil-C5-methylase (TrmA/RlmC/RlmD family)
VLPYWLQVIGVDVCATSVREAEANAKLNNVNGNTKFVCGRVEDKLQQLLKARA